MIVLNDYIRFCGCIFSDKSGDVDDENYVSNGKLVIGLPRYIRNKEHTENSVAENVG